MQEISTNRLFADIENKVKQSNESLLKECEQRLNVASRNADEVRRHIISLKEKKKDYENQLQKQQNLISGCRERRASYQSRVELAIERYRQAESSAKSSAEEHSRSLRELARINERYNALTLSAPNVSDNYDAELEAYKHRMKSIQSEIDRISKEIEQLSVSGGANSGDASLKNALIIQLNKLKGDKASIPRPVENAAATKATAEHSRLMKESQESLDKAEREEQAKQDASNRAQIELSDANITLNSLRNEPEMDRKIEKEATDRTIQLMEILSDFSTVPSPDEQQILNEERSAIEVSEATDEQVKKQIEAAKQCFQSSPLSQEGKWDLLCTLTGKRNDAVKIWNMCVESELQAIQETVVPDLSNVQSKNTEAEKKYGYLADWHPTNSEDLSSNEAQILESKFTPEQRAVLESGGTLYVKTTRGCSSWLAYIFFGFIISLLLTAIPLSMDQIGKEFESELFILWPILWCVLVIIFRFRGRKQKVEMVSHGSGLKFINTPNTPNFKEFNRVQSKKLQLEERTQGRSELIAAREELASEREHLDAYLRQNFPESLRDVPLDCSPALTEEVEGWYRQTLESSLEKGGWPTIRLDRLRAQPSHLDNSHFKNVYTHWESELKSSGLVEFVG